CETAPSAGCRMASLLAPLVLGTALFLANNVGLLNAHWNAPPGTVSLGAHRNSDTAQYLTWIRGYRSDWLLPDFHAPWRTERALWNPFFLLLGRTAQWTGASDVAVYQASRWLVYVFAAFALQVAFRTFLRSRGERVAALLGLLCVVPLQSLVQLPS